MISKDGIAEFHLMMSDITYSKVMKNLTYRSQKRLYLWVANWEYFWESWRCKNRFDCICFQLRSWFCRRLLCLHGISNDHVTWCHPGKLVPPGIMAADALATQGGVLNTPPWVARASAATLLTQFPWNLPEPSAGHPGSINSNNQPSTNITFL